MASKPKAGLGRGLDALLGDFSDDLGTAGAETSRPEPAADGEAVLSVSLADIDPNRDQPRRRFDEAALEELAASIRAVGVLQPILCAKSGDRYTIIAGERRWRAARMAGLTEIPVILRDWDQTRRLEAALVENLQRDDLNPVEEASGVKRLMDECGLTQEQTAERLGRSRPAVANLLRLLTLPVSIQDMLRDGRLSAGHARALVPLERADQVRLAQLCVNAGWSVRQLEKACAARPAAPRPAPVPRDPEFKRLERMARDVFGSKVELSGNEQRGKMIVHYQTAEDLQRIWDLLEMMSQNEA